MTTVTTLSIWLGFWFGAFLQATPILFTVEELNAAEAEVVQIWGSPSEDSGFWQESPEIWVNDKKFPRPDSFASARALAQSILNEIRNAPAGEVRLRIGENTYWLDKSPLGEGGTGFIFKMEDPSLILKISKANAIGIRSMLFERAAATRIEELARQNGFSTPKNIYFDSLGLLSVKERIHAPSVSEVLIQEGVIELIETPEGVVAQIHSAVASRSAKVRAIGKQIENLLRVRKRNPDLVLDLAPDNLFVVENAGGEIEISLVDIGPSGPKTKKLIDGARDFKGYLQVAATQIKRNTELGFRVLPKPRGCVRYLLPEVAAMGSQI